MSKKELIELLTEVLGPLTPMVLRQIDKFIKQGLTYKEIARAVVYLYSVTKKLKIESVATYGIALVPEYVNAANNYYDEIKRQQESQKKQVDAAKDINQRLVSPQKRVKRKRGIDINEL